MGLVGRSPGPPTDGRPQDGARSGPGPILEDDAARNRRIRSTVRMRMNAAHGPNPREYGPFRGRRRRFDNTRQPKRQLLETVCGSEHESPGFWKFAIVWFPLAFAMPTFFIALGLFSSSSDTSSVAQITWGIILGLFAFAGVLQLARSGTESNGNGLQRRGLLVEGTRAIPWGLMKGFCDPRLQDSRSGAAVGGLVPSPRGRACPSVPRTERVSQGQHREDTRDGYPIEPGPRFST